MRIVEIRLDKITIWGYTKFMDTTKSLTANLRELKDNPKYLGMFEYLFARKRDCDSSTINTIYAVVRKKYSGVKFQDAIEFFKKFEELGIGRIIHENGKPLYTFHWDKTVTGIAKAVNNSGPYCGVQIPDLEECPVLVSSVIPMGKENIVAIDTYEFPLRKNFKVRIPKDLTRKEAEYFKQFIDNSTGE